ncbi:hypothetical protein CHCC5027_3527 [Bacillus paralicheniformis]|nr:hypothetical protein CHCC5027_3527 [Bacillus paralicheniformis]
MAINGDFGFISKKGIDIPFFTVIIMGIDCFVISQHYHSHMNKLKYKRGKIS